MKKFSVLIILILLLAISGIFGIRVIMTGMSSTVLNSITSFLFGIDNVVHFPDIVSENEDLKNELLDLRARLIEAEDILNKLNLKNIVELTLYAVKKGIIDPSDM